LRPGGAVVLLPAATAVAVSVAVSARVRITVARGVVGDRSTWRSRSTDLLLDELLGVSNLLRVASNREILPVRVFRRRILVDLHERARLFFDAIDCLAAFADDDTSSTSRHGVIDLLLSAATVVTVHAVRLDVPFAVENKLRYKLKPGLI